MIRSTVITILLFTFLYNEVSAQYILSGKVTAEDGLTPIPNATVHLVHAHVTTLSGTDGSFLIHTRLLPDSLTINSIGFATGSVYIEPKKTDNIRIAMKSASNQLQAVIVGSSKQKATSFMEKVINAKDGNNFLLAGNYHYRRYTKNELDIGNLDFVKRRNRVLDTLLALYKNIDADAQGRKEAAIYFDERMVNVYHSQSPQYDAENMIAKKSLGLETDVLLSKLTKFYFHFNIYNNWLPVFDQSYVSPLNTNAFAYYKFFEGDSSMEAGRMIQQVHFTPTHPYERAFTGDLWIDKETLAITAVSMHISRTADINFVHDIHYQEEYKETIDSLSGKHLYLPDQYSSETEFENGLDLVGIPVKSSEKATVFLFRTTTSITDLQLNSDDATAMIRSAEKEKTTDWNQPDDYWQNKRPVSLTAHEISIYEVADSFQANRMIRRNLKLVSFGSTGYWNIGNSLAIGPYSLFLSRNPVEGWRVRPGFLTLTGFHKKLNLNGYAAYGTNDKKLKGSIGVKYIWNAARWTRTSVAFGSDYDLAVENDEELDEDNLISSFLRKPVPYSRTYVSQFIVKHEQYLSPDWGVSGAVLYKELTPVFPFQYHPINPVTDKPSASVSNRLPVAEAMIGFRYAHSEKTKVYNYDQIHIRTFSPVITASYAWGIELGNARFPFHKADVGIEQMLRLPPKSLLYYKVSAGQTFGTMPYLLLNIPQGNEYYVVNKYQFNTMLPYEFAADRYVSLHTRLSLGGSLFSKVPLLKKLGWRERFSFSSFWGDMTKANLEYNKSSAFRTASQMPFMEGSAGVENIFHILSVEYYRRFSYLNNRSLNGGIFLGITLNF